MNESTRIYDRPARLRSLDRYGTAFELSFENGSTKLAMFARHGFPGAGSKV